MSEQITDHIDQAHALMKSQYLDAHQFRALVEVVVAEVQKLEDVAWDVLVKTTLDEAEGAQLDQWGQVLAEKRGGLNDDEYRAILKVVAAAYQSDAHAPITILIASTILDTAVRYRQSGRAAYVLEYVLEAHPSSEHSSRIRRILDLLPPSGVEYAAYEAVSAGAGAFRFDSGPGFDQGQLARRADQE